MPHVVILSAMPVTRLDRCTADVAGAVARRGATATVASSIELATARWSHRVESGSARTVVHLADGRVIDTAATDAVLNRIPALAPIGFGGADERERNYAAAEFQALFVSFLRSFGCRVVNGVDGHGPLGLWSWTRWIALAHRCGLAALPRPIVDVAGVSAPATFTLTVVGADVFDARDGTALTGRTADRCRRLARAAALDVLGLTLAGGPVPQLAGVDPFPHVAGPTAVAMAELLCAAASRGRAA
jgi:hypothetical protein